MRIPYTYALKCPDDRVYYGAKWGKDANPDTFWNDYFTSSDEVQEMREQYGDDMFEYEIRRTFDNVEDCMRWENRVLGALRAATHPKMVNKSNGGPHSCIQQRRLADGTHNFLDSDWQRENVKRQQENGTHFFSSEEHGKQSSALQKKRIKEGTHHFLDSDLQRRTALKRVEEGTHPFQSKVVCPDCGLESNRSGIARHKCQGLNG